MRPSATRTSVDSGVLIAAVREEAAFVERVTALLADPDRVFVSSVFVRLEVVPKATYQRRRAELDVYEAFFARVTDWAGSLDLLVEMAEREATRYGLNGMDALHVAAATMLEAEELVTTEGPQKPIHRVSGVRVVPL